jgi:hypothetical protein
MGISNPFNVDAALASEHELSQLPPHGNAAIRAFCGTDDPAKDWDARGVCVLKARKGFGKSHLLAVRSQHHRDSNTASRTIFYPQGGRPRTLIDALSSLHVVIPRWLRGKESAAAWVHIWQLSILGLMAWITDARSSALRGYSDWFGSLEHLEHIQKQGNAPIDGSAHPNVMLTLFMGRILERMPADDYNLGMDQLKQGLYYANSDWAIGIKASIANMGKTRIVAYLDAPDELVELDHPGLWRSVQQGLLLAIWKFSKNSTWGNVLNIYASVRSEAFGAGNDHPDIALAMGLVMPLQYTRDELEAMLNDRIKQVAPDKLASPLAGGVRPFHALCGFAEVVHEDRPTPDGGRYKEDVFDSVLRHTRFVPREVIAIAGAIHDIVGERGFDTVRRAVNAAASSNIEYAKKHSFLGWTDAVHQRFAASLCQEVIDRETMEQLASEFGLEAPDVVKFFVHHGLLGIAEPLPLRHRHYYQQRFSFDELHGNADSSSVRKDYFFLHPAFKEWIHNQSAAQKKSFRRLDVGVVGDLKPFEAMPPLIQLCAIDDRLVLKLRSSRRLTTSEKGARSDPLKFLFVALWAYRDLKQPRISLTEIRSYWAKLKNVNVFKDKLTVALPTLNDIFAEKIRDWAKKINRDEDIRRLRSELGIVSEQVSAISRKGMPADAEKSPLIRVSKVSSLGATAEIWFPDIPFDEIDWDERLFHLLKTY